MTAPRRVVRTVGFLDDGSITLEYFTPAEDLKASGVIVSHVIRVPAADDYDAEMDAVVDSVTALLDDVLEDLPVLEPLDLEQEAEGDDDEGTDAEDAAASAAASGRHPADEAGHGGPGPAG